MQIDAPCLDCGSPVHIEMQDGKILKREPETITGYVAVPFAKWMDRSLMPEAP